MLLFLGMVSLMVQQSMQLKMSHTVQQVVDKINENAASGSYIGLVMAYPTEELALQNSAYFVPSSQIPWLDLAGYYSLTLFAFH